MSQHRRNPRRDENEPEIVDALKQAGALVERVNGAGIPDLLVGYRGVLYLLEVKTLKGRLKPAQITFLEAWAGYPTISIVKTVDEALRAIGAID